MNAESTAVQETEDERLRQVGKLAADSGVGWADGFRPGTSGCHELLDRTQLMADMLERHLLDHPACIADAQWYALADRAAAALRELYQRVGADHLTAENTDSCPSRHLATSDPGDEQHNPDVPNPKEENDVSGEHDVEDVASYLHGAARALDQVDAVRRVLQKAAQKAQEMNAAPGDHATIEEDDDCFGVKGSLARFISTWDVCERHAREDEAS